MRWLKQRKNERGWGRNRQYGGFLPQHSSIVQDDISCFEKEDDLCEEMTAHFDLRQPGTPEQYQTIDNFVCSW